MANKERFQQAAERIYHDWDDALSNDDVEGLLALYAPNAVLESPAVPLTMGAETGYAADTMNCDRCSSR
jgi:ketosteroid isomerase-like protein